MALELTSSIFLNYFSTLGLAMVGIIMLMLRRKGTLDKDYVDSMEMLIFMIVPTVVTASMIPHTQENVGLLGFMYLVVLLMWYYVAGIISIKAKNPTRLFKFNTIWYVILIAYEIIYYNQLLISPAI